MGRLALRAVWDCPDVSIVHVNEIKGGARDGGAPSGIRQRSRALDKTYDRRVRPLHSGRPQVGFTDAAKPNEVPWEAKGVDIVLECSGKLITTDALEPYFERGVRKVAVAAPVKTKGALNIVMGVNDHL